MPPMFYKNELENNKALKSKRFNGKSAWSWKLHCSQGV